MTSKRFGFWAACGVTAFLAFAAMPARAQDADDGRDETSPEQATQDDEDMLSGNLILNVDSNFMSYGHDVWETGTFQDVLFHPQFDLRWKLPHGLSAYIGTWWDVNNDGFSTIGNDVIQEVDVWGGLGWSYQKFSASVTYQEWMYAHDSERIVDLNLAYDTFLKPTLTVHGRVKGNGSQNEGAVFLLGVSHAFEFPYITFNFPVNVGFVTNGYYQKHQGGFGYVNAGMVASVPLSFIPEKYGSWAYNAGLIYYYTDPDNVGNKRDNILTGTTGISLAF